jgi:hypothetical protein
LQKDEQIDDELMLAKTPLIFVSPEWSKMGRAVITRDDDNSYSTPLKTVICSLATDLSEL